MILATASLLAATFAFSGPPSYVVLNLGTLSGGGDSYATAINNNGQVAGYAAVTVGGNEHAVLWTRARAGLTGKYVIQDLGTLGGPGSFASALNESGIVAGFGTESSNGKDFAWVTQSGKLTPLSFMTGGDQARALGINSGSQLVGWSDIYLDGSYQHGQYQHACMWSGGVAVDLDINGAASYADGVNDAGVAVGQHLESIDGQSNYNACIFANGGIQDLPVLHSRDRAAALAINNSGEIVGWSGKGNNGTYACLWSNGSVVNLGAPNNSQATGINASGEIVGWSEDSSLPCFLNSGGQIYNLQSLLDPADRQAYELLAVYGINDAGWIVGEAYLNPDDDQIYAVLLIPGPTAINRR